MQFFNKSNIKSETTLIGGFVVATIYSSGIKFLNDATSESWKKAVCSIFYFFFSFVLKEQKEKNTACVLTLSQDVLIL